MNNIPTCSACERETWYPYYTIQVIRTDGDNLGTPVPLVLCEECYANFLKFISNIDKDKK